MFDAEDIYQATRAIRPQLMRMLGEQKATSLEKNIDELLLRAEQGEKVENLLLKELTQEDQVREWLKTALLDDGTRGMSWLPGNPGAVSGIRYICPKENGHFEWYLRRKGRPVPACPIHGIPLILGE